MDSIFVIDPLRLMSVLSMQEELQIVIILVSEELCLDNPSIVSALLSDMNFMWWKEIDDGLY